MSDIDALSTIPCPNCRQPMRTQDLERNDHGTVRVELCFTCAGIWFEAELQRVRSQVRQICCSQCGGPIDLEHSSECPYCHAPVSFLDPGAVEKALQMWSEAESRRRVAGYLSAATDMTLPLTHNVVRLIKLIHLSAIERARMIYA